MIKPVDLLEVRMHGDLLGRLTMAPDLVAVFEYDASWIANGFSISPFYLPLRAGAFTAKRDPFDGLFGVFNDSLPDGWGNLLLDRLLLKNGIKPASLNPIGRLSIVGSSGMGALTYHPENKLIADQKYTHLNDLALEVEKILHEESSDSLEELFEKGGSSGGARPKVLVQVDGEEWLIKFKSSEDPDDIGLREYQYSQLAKKCGIEMPETRLFENRFFGVKRFDRVNGRRFHVHSASGLLYASHRFPSLDYAGLFNATMVLTRNIEELKKLFRQMVFNILIENKDDHAKNFSFIYDGERWYLSPAYDLLKSNGFNNQHSTTINGKGRPEKDDIFEVARQAGLSRKTAQIIYEEVKGYIRS